MKKIIFVLTLVCTQVFAQKWTSLFDGKTLKGWTQKGGQAVYKVEKKQIVGETVANTPNSFLCTENEYGDFILELDLKLDDEMNGGVQFRSLSKQEYQNGRVHGYQMEVDPSPRAWSGGIYDEGRRDWLYNLNQNPEGQKAFKKLDWNHYRIEAIGSTIRTFINGVPTAHLIDDMTEKGFIALQVHGIYGNMKPGMKIRWKNIRIQTENLVPSPLDNCPVVNLLTNNISEQEKAQGFKLLFNGKNFDGWHNQRKSLSPDSRWKIEDGILAITANTDKKPGIDLLSDSLYAAFELQFDFKLTDVANSGVKYFVEMLGEEGRKAALGLEYQVLDDEKHPDAKQGVVGNRTMASLYDLIPSDKLDPRFQRKIGGWNQAKVVALPDNTVQHWLNGFKVLEYKRRGNIYKALVARSKYAVNEGFGMGDKGHILLQDHNDLVYFKNIKIRELK
ncbi:MAG: DUF1080 domain-containing protein [Spirosomataceae bacterium]|jgi:hypothetical protein